MGELLQIYQTAVGPVPPSVDLPPPTEKPLAINTGEELAGRLIAYTDGSVIPDTGSATASCVMPALGWTASCRQPFAACSTAAETAGVHLEAGLLAANPPTCPVALGCDSRAALLSLAKPERAGFATQGLVTKLHALLASGVNVSLHWVPSHVGIQGNEQADALAKEAHHSAVTVCRTVVASDFLRLTLRRLLLRYHPDDRVVRWNHQPGCLTGVSPGGRGPCYFAYASAASGLRPGVIGLAELRPLHALRAGHMKLSSTCCVFAQRFAHNAASCSPHSVATVCPPLHRGTFLFLHGTAPRSSRRFFASLRTPD
ncbi:hypothetical protein HPB51_011364 [Rhipicephalus microplus]|uniref:RNase H type-1 domain-containing protein n=1 Tax=Rhipicephalus microplus TaxID=6941 RepID=A0A9J6D9B4_RHIMP|nr:hypothetical protein HPB51_011364 [Rhipicephalus microplus]